MAFLKFCVVVIAFLLQIRGTNSGDIPAALSRFVSVFNGYYSNVEDVKSKFGSRFYQDEINDTARPVRVTAFEQSVAIYFEQVTNDRLYRQQVLVFSADEAGIITGIPYNFTDISRNRPYYFDSVVLEDLTAKDFEQPPEDCNLVFRELEEGAFFGSWPDCTTKFYNGERPVYAVVFTCDTFSFVTSATASREQASMVPYINKKYTSYPLPPEFVDEFNANGSPCRR